MIARVVRRSCKVGTALAVLGLSLAGGVAAAEPPAPGSGDRCAVCGMFVAKYPNWVAALVFKDGVRVFFDGPKDLFRYLQSPTRYGAKKDLDKDDIAGIWVTDYYSTHPIDAQRAFFVVGSDVMGPMGPELVPLASREKADSFRADHGGKRILSFDEMRSEAVAP
jgi:copper chaperone NosL